MKQETPIEDQWLPYEIHPDTPPNGVLLADYFPGMNPEGFFRQMNARGEEYGAGFGPQTLMSNSRMAMEAGEFAKEQGLHEPFHEAVFKAFFTDCLNIGDLGVIRSIAKDTGLDVQAMDEALDSGAYLPRLKETTRMARENNVAAAPTFFIEGAERIVGAQPEKVFRAALERAVKSRQ